MRKIVLDLNDIIKATDSYMFRNYLHIIKVYNNCTKRLLLLLVSCW